MKKLLKVNDQGLPRLFPTGVHRLPHDAKEVYVIKRVINQVKHILDHIVTNEGDIFVGFFWPFFINYNLKHEEVTVNLIEVV